MSQPTGPADHKGRQAPSTPLNGLREFTERMRLNTSTPIQGNEERSFRFFQTANHRRIPDAPESELKYTNRTARMSEIRRVMGKPDRWTDSPVTLIKYIDDYNGVETLNAHEAITESS